MPTKSLTALLFGLICLATAQPALAELSPESHVIVTLDAKTKTEERARVALEAVKKKFPDLVVVQSRVWSDSERGSLGIPHKTWSSELVAILPREQLSQISSAAQVKLHPELPIHLDLVSPGVRSQITLLVPFQELNRTGQLKKSPTELIREYGGDATKARIAQPYTLTKYAGEVSGFRASEFLKKVPPSIAAPAAKQNTREKLEQKLNRTKSKPSPRKVR